ncbi:MAG: SU10 major capsid protein, partial [Candidatus Hodarchaeales archaeon]
QSSAELQDVYDPVIYNALNQETVTWNLLAKDDESKKGNNHVQFTLKTAANTSASFYSGNAVATGNVTRQKYQTKFKKLQVGVSVDGDMIAAARGGPVSDVFAQEVLDSAVDMLAVLNAALFAEVGLETADAIIGFEYITDSAGNTTLYNLARSAANKLAPDSAGDTYIDQGSTLISMGNLRAAVRQAVLEGANERNLVFVTNHIQADLYKGKFDDSRRMLAATDTDFGFKTDVWMDSVPVFRDKDCNTDDWFLVDLETHRVAIWIPPTLEKLGKLADSEDAFIKTYFATYNRGPRRMVQIHSASVTA